MRQRPQTLKLLFNSTHTEATAFSPGALALLRLQLSIDKPLTAWWLTYPAELPLPHMTEGSLCRLLHFPWRKAKVSLCNISRLLLSWAFVCHKVA